MVPPGSKNHLNLSLAVHRASSLWRPLGLLSLSGTVRWRGERWRGELKGPVVESADTRSSVSGLFLSAGGSGSSPSGLF